VTSARVSNKKVDTRAKYDRAAPWYDLFEFITEALVYTYWRKELLKWIKGDKFLEIGVGTGKNLRYYPKNAKITTIDFSEGMLSYAKRRATVGSHINVFGRL